MVLDELLNRSDSDGFCLDEEYACLAVAHIRQRLIELELFSSDQRCTMGSPVPVHSTVVMHVYAQVECECECITIFTVTTLFSCTRWLQSRCVLDMIP